MEHDIGFWLGILTGLGAAALLLGLLKNKKAMDMPFDERQERARGMAFQCGFFTLIGSLAVYGLWDALFGRWCETLTGCVLCICIALTVFAAICIQKDAYLSLKERPGAVMALLAGLSVVNLAFGAALGISGRLVEDGLVTVWACNPIAGGMAALILAVYAAKQFRDRKRGGE